MPIKFRCQHCRQFLGISRSQAGAVMDCPTCGRTIRIPELDGTVKPLPKPSLNMQDSRLAAALDELAGLNERPSEGGPSSSGSFAEQLFDENQSRDSDGFEYEQVNLSEDFDSDYDPADNDESDHDDSELHSALPEVASGEGERAGGGIDPPSPKAGAVGPVTGGPSSPAAKGRDQDGDRSAKQPPADGENKTKRRATPTISNGARRGAAATGTGNPVSREVSAGLATADEKSFIDVAPLPPSKVIDPLRHGGDDDDDDASGDDQGSPWNSTAQPRDSWRRLLAAAAANDDPASDDAASARAGRSVAPGTDPVSQAPDAESASVASASASTPVAVGEQPVDRPVAGTQSAPQRVQPQSLTSRLLKPLAGTGSMWLAVAGVSALLISTGFWIGRLTSTPATDAASGGPIDEDSASDPFREGAQATRGASLAGRITYRTSEGERKPDRGARIVVVPVERQGSAKVSVDGLRIDTAPEDRKLIVAAVEAMGGAVTLADDAGEFQVKLPNAGQYHVLVLSNFLSSDLDVDTAPVEATFERYFDRPAQLLGTYRFHVEQLRWPGTLTTTWDHCFIKD